MISDTSLSSAIFQQGTTTAPPPVTGNPDFDNTYAVDFETYYDKECTVKLLGNHHYCRHPMFDAYLVSIYGPGVSFVGHPQEAPWHLIRGKGKRWISHNAGFDEAVQLSLIESKAIPADALPEEWLCTADMAAYFGAPRAMKLALKWFFNMEISKQARDDMKGKYWYMLGDEQKATMLAYAMDDSVYCRDKLWLTLAPLWPAHERKLSTLTRTMGRRGVKLDIPLLHEGLAKLRAVKETSRQIIPWAPEDLDNEKGILSKKQLNLWCKEQGIEAPSSLAKDSPECLAWEEKYGDSYPVVGAMRDHRRSNILLKKLEKMESRLLPNGRMIFYLKYFGACITGRWSGDGGLNMQNQNRDEVFGVDLRHITIAGEGCKFAIADSSQIEPRTLAWLAGNTGFLQKIREGFGVYEAFAVAKGKWPAEKKGKLKKEDPSLYKWAKAAVLGLGYGCGKDKFILVAKIMADLVITLEESTAMVNDFRTTETHTTDLWKKLEKAMKCHIGKDFLIQLPTGRLLRYRKVEVEDGGGLSAEVVKQVHGAEKVIRMRYWGGVLTENIVQATAREIFAAIMLRLEAAGIPVVMQVHDEVICEVPAGTQEEEEAMKLKIEGIMSATPGFMKGLPLGCESQFSTHYLK